jgi:hypothetical protein
MRQDQGKREDAQETTKGVDGCVSDSLKVAGIIKQGSVVIKADK